MKTNLMKLLVILAAMTFFGAGAAMAKDRYGDRKHRPPDKTAVHTKVDRHHTYGNGRHYTIKITPPPGIMVIITVPGITRNTTLPNITTNITRRDIIPIVTTMVPEDIRHITVFPSDWRCVIPMWPFQSVSTVVKHYEDPPIEYDV
ncbi:MAG: hypothetical protein AB1Z20_09525 [Desulfobacterales bacterium]|jgi:hypothetical protein